MEKKVKVISPETQDVFFECTFEEITKAYDYLKFLEEIGVLGVLETPTVTQSLAEALGVSGKNGDDLAKEVEEEIDSH